MSSLDYLDLCRLCLVKDRVSVPIFEGEGDVRQIFLKITACLPVKVNREDKLPKKICDDCVYKVELCYQFWHTTANAEKQLLQWLGEVNMEDKSDYNVLNPNGIKTDQSNENRLDGTVMQQVSEHQNNMNMGMMDNISLGMPMIMTNNAQQQITSVPMDNSSSVQTVQAVAGPSTQTTHDQITQNQTDAPAQQEEEEESSEEEENSDDECDGDEGLPIKEEGEEDPNNSRTIEPTTFVNVSLACDEAGPSGLQQQKIADMPEMVMQQTADDPKTGYFVTKLSRLPQDRQQRGPGKMKYVLIQGNKLRIAGSRPQVEMKNITQKIILQYKCCGESFVSEQDFNLHLKTHESRLKEQMQPQQDDQLICEHCGCIFMTILELRKHQKEHEQHISEEHYSCNSCDYVASSKRSLITHEQSHIPEHKYQCEICGEQFDSKSSCQVHILSHTREKPFQCDICNATFRYRQGLRLHTKLHQPDYVPPQRKHHCELCNKRFSRRQVLLVHMKTHGNVEPQNEYVCTMCGKSVSSKTYLAVHLRKHTGEKPHVCDICGKGFISQNYLSVHRRTHTGEKPHQCTHCNKRFTQRTTLVVHLRGHTGDRPYPCTYCQKSFASKTMLNSHLKTHAKQNVRQQQDQHQIQQQHQQQEEEEDEEEEEDLLPLETVAIML